MLTEPDREGPRLLSPTPTVWIGTSGWVYKHWKAVFYPATLPGAQQLVSLNRDELVGG